MHDFIISYKQRFLKRQAAAGTTWGFRGVFS